MKRISRAKYIAFAIVAVSSVLFGAGAAVLGVDLYLHHKFEKAAGLNVWGYRGPVVGHKRPNEIRVAVVGGSTALGYGLSWSDAFPHLLEVALNSTEAAKTHHFVVVNLGFNGNGAYSFRYTLADYEYLDYDIVCLYEGYNDLRSENRRVSRHESAVFRLTGYLPILPVVAREKAMQLRYGGDLRAAYRGAPVVFRPNLGDRSKASAIEASLAIVDALEQRFGFKSDDPTVGSPSSSECSQEFGFYCEAVALAVSDTREMHKPVLVITQPYVNDRHRRQQHELQTMLAKRWPNDPSVRRVDLGDAVDLRDSELCWDGMHLTPSGNQKIALGLVRPVLKAVPFVDR